MNDKDFEIERLKAKVKRLEQELEQAEDDADRLERERRQAERALSDVNTQGDDQSACEVISLINTMLNAPLAIGFDNEETKSEVANIRSIILDEYLPIAGNNSDHDQCRSATEGWSSIQLKPWIKDNKTIAVVGEFSAGKTSIINRILSYNCPDSLQLPVSGDPTTSIATYISYGPQYDVKFADANGRLREISPGAFEKLDNDLLKGLCIRSLISYFVLRYSNPVLRGLCLIDTPGFSSNNASDAIRAIEAVKEADALLWVVDVNAGVLNDTSVRVLREMGDVPICFIINRIDEKSEKEAASVEELIRHTASESGLNVTEFIKFSVKNSPLDSILCFIENQHGRSRGIELAKVLAEMQWELDACSTHVERLSSEIRARDAECKRLMDSVNDKLDIVVDLADVLSRMPNHSWAPFAGAFYKLDTDDYVKYKKRCESVNLTSTNAKIEINNYLKAHRESLKTHLEYDRRKTRFIELSDISKRLKDAFRRYDLTYYNLIYNAAKQMINSKRL